MRKRELQARVQELYKDNAYWKGKVDLLEDQLRLERTSARVAHAEGLEAAMRVVGEVMDRTFPRVPEIVGDGGMGDEMGEMTDRQVADWTDGLAPDVTWGGLSVVGDAEGGLFMGDLDTGDGADHDLS